MRSPAEIRFRLRQELGNLSMLWGRPPRLPDASAPVIELPLPVVDPAEIVPIAESILAHRFPILGLTIETGPNIDWRRDYLHGISTGTPYFRRVPYLDFSRVGDHKVIWELNRHQHLVVLAQAFRATGRREFLEEAFAQLEDWMRQNPFLRGINWASALEVAFRALSWCAVYQLAANEMPDGLRRRFLTALYQHGRYLELNLSVYFSPNTHLLGEAVVLHALGVMFSRGEWQSTGARIVREELDHQVRADGSHFEQSAYYHVYALDFFRLHYQLLGRQPAALLRMAEYLSALLGPSGILPLIGDDDGGRLFHPYGDRLQFGRVLVGQALPPAKSSLFSDAGIAVMTAGDVHIVVKAGPFGEGSGGHSHSDVLSLVARIGDREILIDPGTFTYISDPAERNRFRGSSAHNTLRIDGRDQAIPAGPFRWNDKPVVAIRQFSAGERCDFLDATCTYGGFLHRRRLMFRKPHLLAVLDTVAGPPGPHQLEQFWHLAADAETARFSFTAPAEPVEGWRSRAFASKEPSPVLCVKSSGPLPAAMAAVIDLSPSPLSGELKIVDAGEAAHLTWNGNGLMFPRVG